MIQIGNHCVNKKKIKYTVYIKPILYVYFSRYVSLSFDETKIDNFEDVFQDLTGCSLR